MTYNSRESAEWTLAVDSEAGKLLTIIKANGPKFYGERYA